VPSGPGVSSTVTAVAFVWAVPAAVWSADGDAVFVSLVCAAAIPEAPNQPAVKPANIIHDNLFIIFILLSAARASLPAPHYSDILVVLLARCATLLQS
jgi:hypothetical protein